MSAPNRPDLGGMRVLLDSALLGGMDDPDTHTFVYFHAPTLLAYAERLEAAVSRLRGLVAKEAEAGFREGFVEGRCREGAPVDACWERSLTRAALTQQENTDEV